MNKLFAAAGLAAGIALAPVGALAQAAPADGTDLQVLRQAVKTDKKSYVASVLQLTPAEEKKFWPIYDAYQRHLQVVNTRTARLVEEQVGRDKPMSNRYAKAVIFELIAIDEDETKSLTALSKRVQKVLPTVKAARYVQIERKVRTVQDYDIATVLPYAK